MKHWYSAFFLLTIFVYKFYLSLKRLVIDISFAIAYSVKKKGISVFLGKRAAKHVLVEGRESMLPRYNKGNYF
jgi:hypothetical protein